MIILPRTMIIQLENLLKMRSDHCSLKVMRIHEIYLTKNTFSDYVNDYKLTFPFQ